MDRTPSKRRASRRAAAAYADAGTEPPVAELLDDPITQTLMASDRVRPEDVGALVEATRRRLLARRSHPTPYTKER
jgi:hypothetical protein